MCLFAGADEFTRFFSRKNGGVWIMKKFVFILFVVGLSLAACGGNSASVDDAESVETVPTAVPPSPKPAEPSPEPTELPEPTAPSEPVLITDAADMVGIWLGTVAGEKGYVMYTDDGRYTVALIQDNLGTAPRVSGEYWFEDGQIHLRDLENAGHWVVCDAETVGVYEAVMLEDGQVQFQTVEDGCDEGGFTRNYIFANMMQERIGDPVPIAEAEAAAEVETAPNPELAAALQAVLESYAAENGAGAVLLVDAPDMDFAWKGATGMADPETGLEMIPDDQFIISSGTKIFTAVTILKLMEQGKLSLDDPISLYLPEELVSQLLVLDGQSYGEDITVRQLLSHTSGLGDFSNGADEDGNGLPDSKDLVLNEPDTVWNPDAVLAWAVENAPPVAAPGEMYNYSDTNFQLLGRIVENVSGMRLAEAYRQFIFEPLGMAQTYMEFNEDAAPGVDGRTLSHAFYNGTDWNDLDSHSYEWGSGGLVSTVEDQKRFLRAWADGSLFDDPASREAMMTWGETNDAGVYYGLGMIRFVFDEWGIPDLGEVQGHGGLFNSQAFYWPEQNVIIVGTLNANEPPLGFIGLLIDTLSTVQAMSE
ncbi:MAG TPA: class A beta-lactamase-related serine hydrolase [Anaerolineae bacterium]|nr:class A beta-lactamase-related serine hydrolase [Anaerolineae bacterium]